MITALVLAGTRAGGDPMAAAAGVSHKALIDVGGRTMLERVVGAVRDLPAVGRVVVAIERAELLDALPGLRPRDGLPVVAAMPAAAGPSETVGIAFARWGAPLLVTTADNALLRTAWLAAFLAASPPGADVSAALAPRRAVEAAAPETLRTWLRFSDGDFSGCNLFLLASPAAAGVVAFWRSLESERKRPLTMMRRLGWRSALRYRLGRLALAEAAARLGERSGGAQVSFVTLGDGRAAIDVDKPEDLALVRQLVAAEEADRWPGAARAGPRAIPSVSRSR